VVLAAAVVAGAGFSPASAQTVDLGPIVNPANGSTYYRLGGSSDFQALRGFAQGLGGDLVTINDAAENQWVWETFVQGTDRFLCIGFTDEASEGNFVWTSGQTPGYTNWGFGEPNNQGDEDYTHFNLDQPDWNDVTASSLSGAIVEVPLLGVRNPSFERPVLSDGTTLNGSAPDWTGPTQQIIFFGITREVAVLPPLVDGFNAAYVNNFGTDTGEPTRHSMSQRLNDVVRDNTTYTFSAWFGWRNDNGNRAVGVLELWTGGVASEGEVIGGTLLASRTVELVQGSFVRGSLTYATGVSPFTGQNISVVLRAVPTVNDFAQINFDDVEFVAAPNNGTCESAIEISPNSFVTDTLAGAGAGADACSGFSDPKVWFSVVGTERTLQVNTCDNGGANFDTVLGVYRGSCGGQTCVAENDDSCGLGSSLSFFAKAGERYFISVQNYGGGSSGDDVFTLTVNQPLAPEPLLDTGPVYNPATTTSYYSTTPARWIDERALARTMEGNLVTINNSAENDFVRQTFSPDRNIFIGFNDRATEGTFVWDSGQAPGYANWLPGEPNDLGNEDYAVISPDGRWNDTNGGAVLPGVIEVTNDSCYGAIPLSVPGSFASGYAPGPIGIGEFRCGSSAVIGRGVWFRVVGDGSVFTAETCGGSTNYDTTLRALTGDCNGLLCVTGNDDVCGLSSRISFYAQAGREYFVLVGKFNNAGPGGADQFTLTVSKTPASPPAFTGRSDVNPDECSRYYLIGPGNFLAAADAAAGAGQSLTTVNNAAENEFVRAFGAPSSWIGLTDIDSPGAFAWVDGTPVDYTNWLPGEPNDLSGEAFTQIVANGQWNDLGYTGALPAVSEVALTPAPGARVRGALALDGGDDAARLPDNFWAWPLSEFTIECWFRTTQPGIILGQIGATSGYVPMLYVGQAGRLRAADWAGTPQSSVLPASGADAPVVNDGTWHHVALVRSGPVISLYADGAFVASRSAPASGYDPTGVYTYRVGNGNWLNWPGSAGAGSGPFTGEIDEFRVWGTARTLEEINATRSTRYFNPGLYGNLLVSLDMDDAGGRLAFDPKGGRHGRFEGSPSWTYEDRNADGETDVCDARCAADIDGNGVVNSTDVSEFINIWFADQANGTLNADFNRNGVSNSTDVSDLINAFFEAPAPCL
jgi:hypothetical protein